MNKEARAYVENVGIRNMEDAVIEGYELGWQDATEGNFWTSVNLYKPEPGKRMLCHDFCTAFIATPQEDGRWLDECDEPRDVVAWMFIPQIK